MESIIITDDLRKRLGKKARELRKQAKLSQKEVALRLGISNTDLSSFESRGETIGSLERINALFGVYGYELGIQEKKTLTTPLLTSVARS